MICDNLSNAEANMGLLMKFLKVINGLPQETVDREAVYNYIKKVMSVV
jgi:hypothetical protein